MWAGYGGLPSPWHAAQDPLAIDLDNYTPLPESSIIEHVDVDVVAFSGDKEYSRQQHAQPQQWDHKLEGT